MRHTTIGFALMWLDIASSAIYKDPIYGSGSMEFSSALFVTFKLAYLIWLQLWADVALLPRLYKGARGEVIIPE